MIGQQGQVDDAGQPVSQQQGENTGDSLETILRDNLQFKQLFKLLFTSISSPGDSEGCTELQGSSLMF